MSGGLHWSLRVAPLRNTGAALIPHSAFLILQGLETLGLRMERHCENAEKLANYLNDHDKVSWVNYAALADSPYAATCKKITDIIADVSQALESI